MRPINPLAVITRMRGLVAESMAAAWSQPVATFLSALMLLGMTIAILLTSGRTVAAEQNVLAAIDSSGTRSVVVRAEPGAGIDTSLIDRISGVEGLTWVGGFGPVEDVRNLQRSVGEPVAYREVWVRQQDWNPAGEASTGQVAAATSEATQLLGFDSGIGRVKTISGETLSIVDSLIQPDYLAFIGPVVLRSGVAGEVHELSVIVFVADSPELVAPMTEVVQGLLSPDDPTAVSIETSAAFAELRSLVGGELGEFSRSLVIGVFSATALLAGGVQFGTVLMRRKDFGRRRALGASQRYIFGLVVTQSCLLALSASCLGTAVASLVLAVAGDPLPGFDYLLAIIVLSTLTGVVSSAIPAIFAARREPIKELRVP